MISYNQYHLSPQRSLRTVYNGYAQYFCCLFYIIILVFEPVRSEGRTSCSPVLQALITFGNSESSLSYGRGLFCTAEIDIWADICSSAALKSTLSVKQGAFSVYGVCYLRREAFISFSAVSAADVASSV